ncbi:hypothetical protein RUM43_008310 [Polyplax serrata]|uniref:Uncharacterized protein n=1 Tax=Polyplax serrata TaxID=468196 RepID=A0AAN8Q6Z8_POLSC
MWNTESRGDKKSEVEEGDEVRAFGRQNGKKGKEGMERQKGSCLRGKEMKERRRKSFLAGSKINDPLSRPKGRGKSLLENNFWVKSPGGKRPENPKRQKGFL